MLLETVYGANEILGPRIMLKSVSVHNFIHFVEPQRLEFDEGVNFIIGGNSTGKSAIFELIRRCLSNDISTTTSSYTAEDGRLPYVLCHFEIPPADQDSLHCSNLHAGIFIKKQNERTNLDKKPSLFYIYKALIIEHSNKCFRIILVRFEATYGCSVEEFKSTKYYTVEAGRMADFLRAKCSDIESNKDNIIGLFKYIEESKQENTIEDEVQYIFDKLSEHYVGVLGMRSIGPLQWSKSKKNIHSSRQENYKQACERAEIISELINDDRIDQNLYNSFSRAVVWPYSFEKKGDEIVIFNNEETVTKEKPILKCPEGIVEAEQVALLLSHMDYRTITLEEPDRGMHPQMVVKLRDWVFKMVKGKTVLVISHNPAMVDHLTIDRTFITAKTILNDQISHSVTRFPRGYKKYGRVDEMKQILFSDRVLLVDGFTDKIIVEALFDILNNDSTVQNMTLKSQNKLAPLSVEINEPFCKFLSSIHVAELTGHGSADKRMKFCHELRKDTFRLGDFDEVKKSPKDSSKYTLLIEVKGTSYSKKFRDFTDFKETSGEVRRFTDACKSVELFFWIEGALEKVIDTVADNLDYQIKERMGIPITGQCKQWKKSLVEKEDKDIKTVVRRLIESDEGIRFLYFLTEMHSKFEENARGQKRKGSDAQTELKRLKSNDSFVKCESDDELDDEPTGHNQRTGISQDMNDMGFDESV